MTTESPRAGPNHGGTPRPVVVLAEPIHPDGMDRLAGHAVVEHPAGPGAAALTAAIQDADAVIIRSTQLPAEVFEHASRLRVIGRHGAGYDNIDVAAASELGIAVVNTPRSNTTSVAEFALTLILALAKRLVPAAAALQRSDDWDPDSSLPSQLEGAGLVGRDVAGLTLGLIGCGAIGREVGSRAAALGMEIIGHDPFLDPTSFRSLGIESAGFDDLLRRSDFVSIHVPAEAATAGLIGAAQLALMKPDAHLINTARGSIVDEDALAAALHAGALAGAAVDVFGREPPPADHPLLGCDRVLATPHMAAITEESRQRMSVDVAGAVLAVLDGSLPPQTVNSDRLPGVRVVS